MTLQNLEWKNFKSFLVLEQNFKDTKQAMYANKSRFLKLKKYFSNCDFNRDNFRDFLYKMKTESYSSEYQNRMISMAKNITKYIGESFLNDFKYRTVDSSNEKVLPTFEEVISLIDCDYPYVGSNSWYLKNRDKAMLMFLAYTGCRSGEVSNLKWIDVYGENKRKKVTFRDTKNGDSRTVYIPNQVWEAISKIPRKSEYVFSSYRGNQMLNQGINNVIKSRAEYLGISKNIHAHLLRHTFITEMLDSGAEWFRLSVMVGHKDPKTTRRYYQNSTKSQEELMKKHPLNRKFITFEDVAEEAIESAERWMSVDKCKVSFKKMKNGNISILLSKP